MEFGVFSFIWNFIWEFKFLVLLKMSELMGISNLNWKLSAAEINEETDRLLEKTRKVYDQIGSLQQQDVCFENTVKVVYSFMFIQRTTVAPR